MNGRFILRSECDYSLVAGVNISSLLMIGKSPKHYQDYVERGGRETRAMSLGTAAHAAVLEPMRFQTDFAVWTDTKANGTMAARTGPKWEAFVADHAGQSIVTPKEYEGAAAISRAVQKDPLAMHYLHTGSPEVTLQWTDEATGIQCKGRIDWNCNLAPSTIVDLKTARDVSSWGFCGSASKLDYHTRMAWYADGYETITGHTPNVVVVAIESSKPHDIVCYLMDQDPELNTGRDEYRKLLDRLSECLSSDVWPGIGDGKLQRFQLAKWKLNANEENLEGLDLDWTGTEE